MWYFNNPQTDYFKIQCKGHIKDIQIYTVKGHAEINRLGSLANSAAGIHCPESLGTKIKLIVEVVSKLLQNLFFVINFIVEHAIPQR